MWGFTCIHIFSQSASRTGTNGVNVAATPPPHVHGDVMQDWATTRTYIKRQYFDSPLTEISPNPSIKGSLVAELIMPHQTFIGSGPNCYASSMAMVLQPHAPSTAILEFATSSAFGMQTFANNAFFDPVGWDPLQGMAQALPLVGWESSETISPNETEALQNLKNALEEGPVIVGPVEMGFLKHSPTASGPIGADHFVVPTRIADGQVEFHDPAGYPYAILPIADFLKAWRTDSLDYGKSYTMRHGFKKVEDVSDEEAIRRAIPFAREWLAVKHKGDMPPDTKGNREATEVLAKKIETQFSPDIKDHLIFFAVQCGARRTADAATCLAKVGYDKAANVMSDISRKIGHLQHPLVVSDTEKAAALLREIGPLYDELEAALNEK